jgi:hypothetical protein
MERGPMLCARFSEEKSAVRKIECGERPLSSDFRIPFLPMKSTGDHEMENEKQVAVEFPDDLFSDAAQSDDVPLLSISNRRVEAPKKKWAGEADSL